MSVMTFRVFSTSIRTSCSSELFVPGDEPCTTRRAKCAPVQKQEGGGIAETTQSSERKKVMTDRTFRQDFPKPPALDRVCRPFLPNPQPQSLLSTPR